MINIYGASDDLIEVESDNREKFTSEEFNVDSDYENLIAVSDGTLFSLQFNRRGLWRADLIAMGPAFRGVVSTPDSDDVVTIDNDSIPIQWVVLGRDFA